MLRDHGPDDPGLLLALLVLGTYMDGNGFAFPGQPTWAKAARKSVRMLQRYIAQARRLGWLNVVNAGRGGQGWAFNGYRCCVPEWVELDEKDQSIGDALESQEGSIEGDDTAMSQPPINGHDTRMSLPPARVSPRVEGDDMARSKVTTSRAEGDDKDGYKLPTSGCRTNSHSENSRSITQRSEEAALARSALVKSVLSKKTEAEKAEEASRERQQALERFLKAGLSAADIAHNLQRFGVTLAEAQTLKEEWDYDQDHPF